MSIYTKNSAAVLRDHAERVRWANDTRHLPHTPPVVVGGNGYFNMTTEQHAAKQRERQANRLATRRRSNRLAKVVL